MEIMDVERPAPSMSVFVSLLGNAVADRDATSIDVNDSVEFVLKNADPNLALAAYTDLGILCEKLDDAHNFKPANLPVLLEHLRFLMVVCIVLNGKPDKVEKVFPGLKGMNRDTKRAFVENGALFARKCAAILLEAEYASKDGDNVRFDRVDPWTWEYK